MADRAPRFTIFLGAVRALVQGINISLLRPLILALMSVDETILSVTLNDEVANLLITASLPAILAMGLESGRDPATARHRLLRNCTTPSKADLSLFPESTLDSAVHRTLVIVLLAMRQISVSLVFLQGRAFPLKATAELLARICPLRRIQLFCRDHRLSPMLSCISFNLCLTPLHLRRLPQVIFLFQSLFDI